MKARMNAPVNARVNDRGLSRRNFLKALGGVALAGPLAQLLFKRASAAPMGGARRLIVMYFPDGVAGWSFDGGPSRWHATGTETNFQLTKELEALAPFQSQCVFLNGLSMGGTDAGSHPGGAKKLLTAVDHGDGESIDRFLARTAGANARFNHLYLGAMATDRNASGDKFIYYLGPGTTASPEDNPLAAFGRLFANGMQQNGGPDPAVKLKTSVLDNSLADLNELRARLGDTEKAKLDIHLSSIREVEKQITGMGAMGMVPPASCNNPTLDLHGSDGRSYRPEDFPSLLRAQIDLMVLAMSCGLTKVGVVQASQHTSELSMSHFMEAAELYRMNYDMRSHQASHHGNSTDLFTAYVAQRRWFVQQYAYLLNALKSRPEGDGNMLDYSLVLLCSEISDGNVHSHDNMPFILAGGGGGAVRTGRLLQFNNQRHSPLFVAIARAMGQNIPSFGQDGASGPLGGLLA